MGRIKCFHGKFQSIYIYIDGIKQKTTHKKNYTYTDADLSVGNHIITIGKCTLLNHWYWWLTAFNIFTVASSIRGFDNKALGYDGKFVEYCFSVQIKQANDVILEFSLNDSEYNDNGYMGIIYSIENTGFSGAKLIKSNRMNLTKDKILRHRISRWLPYAFYFSIFYIYIILHIFSYGIDSLVKSCSLAVIFTFGWLIFEIISSHMQPSLEQILENSKRGNMTH